MYLQIAPREDFQGCHYIALQFSSYFFEFLSANVFSLSLLAQLGPSKIKKSLEDWGFLQTVRGQRD